MSDDPYERVLDKIDAAWRDAEPGLLAVRDQQAAKVRSMLAEFGVDLNDPVVKRALTGLTWVMNQEGMAHARQGCCDQRLAMAAECLRVASVTTLLLR